MSSTSQPWLKVLLLDSFLPLTKPDNSPIYSAFSRTDAPKTPFITQISISKMVLSGLDRHEIQKAWSVSDRMETGG
jgi:hypothetical protein